jgi:hypothetical protein
LPCSAGFCNGTPNPAGIPSELCQWTYKDICRDTNTSGGGVFAGSKDDTICGLELVDESCKAD